MSEFKYFEFRPHGGIYFDKENADIMFQYMDDLEDRIKELQELVMQMHNCARENSCSRCYFMNEKCDFADHMRELGVEV